MNRILWYPLENEKRGTFPIVQSREIWALSQATFVRFGYDLSYRVRAPEAASATTQRTENPIRRLFVFLDPRA